MRILLVDDDERLRHVLRRLLSTCDDVVISEASDGQEALELLRRETADLILTDLHMPGMDGISMVRALRAEGHRTPVIMLSGQDDSNLIVTAIRAGVDNYIPKPVHPAVLLEKIHQTLGAGLAAS